MANPKSKPNEPLKELPTKFIPNYTAALPDWAENVTEDIIKSANLKGSPGFEPGSDQALQVEQLTALGLASREIAAILRIEPKLLEKYYKYEIETASSRTTTAVAKIALQMALSGRDSEMTKFWLKTQGGWKETKQVELTGQGGGPIQFQEIKQRIIDSIEAEIIDAEIISTKDVDR